MKALYLTDRSKYAPFAFWKMDKMTGEGAAFYDATGDCLYAIRDKQLLFYHAGDERRFHIPIETLNGLDFIVLRMCDFTRIKDRLEGFRLDQGWTLYYDFDFVPKTYDRNKLVPVDFDFSDAAHYKLASRLLLGEDNPDRIKRWTALPAFDPSLWIWIKDVEADRLVSIGISGYHREMRETDLDWIEVDAEFRNRGIGRILLSEIVNRSIARSNVIRVGGVADGFYKKCGFYERELFGVAIKPGFAFNEQ